MKNVIGQNLFLWLIKFAVVQRVGGCRVGSCRFGAAGLGVIILVGLLAMFCHVDRVIAQDWQPNITASFEAEEEGEESLLTPLPDEPVRLSGRLLGNRSGNVAGKQYANQTNYSNRIIHAAYNSPQYPQNQNNITPQIYNNEVYSENYSQSPTVKKTAKKTSPPKPIPVIKRVSTGNTSTANMTAAVKPKALPKHVSRDFDVNFNVDAALDNYDDLPIDNGIIVRRPLSAKNIQASNIDDYNYDSSSDAGTLNNVVSDDSVSCDSCGSQVGCEHVVEGYCMPMITKPFGTGLLDNLVIFGGVTGFKAGELDGQFGDNFGFSEGFNWSGPIAVQNCVFGAQLGFRATHSNINGNFAKEIDFAEKSHRTEYFITAGLFKRSIGCPLQAGVVFDHFQDNLFGKISLTQFRAELSVRTFTNLEYGFIGGFGLEGDGSEIIDRRENYLRGTVNSGYTYEVDLQQYYMLFVRKHFPVGGQAEFRIGATEYGNVFMGANGDFPISDRIAINGGFSTIFPGGNNKAWQKESWELSLGLVIYFRGGAMSKSCNENRPMFDVAQNGSLVSRIRRNK
ncbi:MAG: hypothetical protein LBQ66_04530 [Planctomycetaceae bacterium]|jgi:hypothetical protein|nr:hypothetical protein [Planctomycetaceae bacterium]